MNQQSEMHHQAAKALDTSQDGNQNKEKSANGGVWEHYQDQYLNAIQR